MFASFIIFEKLYKEKYLVYKKAIIYSDNY